MADGGSPPCLSPYRVLGCSTCRHADAPCRPGLAFLNRLCQALALAPVGADFDISGSASLCCGTRLCPVVWCATPEGARLWGDVPPEVPVAALLDPEQSEALPGSLHPPVRAAAEITAGPGLLH